ncbi:MAG: flippase-like domain-containing protein [Proteobacteria bacterium]|nr:flippase-like domain-containing protein [Pseudomonadota bacterium]
MSEKKAGNTIKLVLGIIISIIFLYLAFGKIDPTKMKESFLTANYWFFIPATLVMFFSHWTRSVRWRYFLKSIKTIRVNRLFSATLIGYMGNSILPAHLGEIFRANVVGRNEGIPTSSVLATVVIERIIDVLTLLIIMLIAVFAYPFPEWVTLSGYIMFAGVAALFLFLFLLKQQHKLTVSLMNFGLNILPQKISKKLEELIYTFIDGLNGMKKRRDYIKVIVYSLVIWFCYWLVFYILFYSFDLVETYSLNAVSSLVLLVITTISVVVPSSPGYIGTYHFLCMKSLELFGVPSTVGLSYAFIAHGISIVPTAIVGFVLAWKEGISRLSQKDIQH